MRVTELVRCEYFRLHEIRLSEPAQHDPEGFARILVVLEGEGEIRGSEGETRPLSFGDTVLLPARMGPVSVAPGVPAGAMGRSSIQRVSAAGQVLV